jgi:hypothetical protein
MGHAKQELRVQPNLQTLDGGRYADIDSAYFFGAHENPLSSICRSPQPIFHKENL